MQGSISAPPARALGTLSGSHHMPQEAHSWLIIDDVILSFTRPGLTDDALWIAFAKDLRNAKVSKYVGAAVGVIDVTSVQRKIVADALRERKLPVAAISDERLVRGMITACAPGELWRNFRQILKTASPFREEFVLALNRQARLDGMITRRRVAWTALRRIGRTRRLP